MAKRARKAATRPTRPTTIRQLWDRFAMAVAKMEATPTAAKPGKISNPAFDRAVSKANDLAKLIVVHPAEDLEEMHLKIKAALWSADGQPFDKLDNWKPSHIADNEQIDALLSLRRDLKQLQEENRKAVAHMLKLYWIDPEGKDHRGPVVPSVR